MPGQGSVSDWTKYTSSAEPSATVRTESGVGGGGSARHSYYHNSKCTERLKDGHKVDSHTAKLQELWKTPQTIHILKSIKDASFRKHPDLTTGQKRYLCSIAKIYNANYLRTLMKRQYMHAIQHSSLKPGVLTHHRNRFSSRYAQKQYHPCTTWRHQLEREDSARPNITTACAPEMMVPHPLWQPLRNKEGLKSGYTTKTRCKSLKIFRRPSRLFMQPVSTKDLESYMNEEKKEEDLLNKCMQSMSIEEQGEHLMLT
ncbi:PREDICTED: protein FAM216A [Chrysochloris asiatica]|uniref:Protein FAM216A n=1 Tax=Chrysochloris asiatica TaxID=185453 RepID=A0A9B0TPX1_CHRAS|nr:PREDICTED: protein FAM216A [Chrysochloris asiatica]